VNRCLLSDVAHTTVTGARAAAKGMTRQALLDAALELSADKGLASVSLREVTRAAGVVPAAFYRHFTDVAALGVALVDQSLGRLRGASRLVRGGLAGSDEMIDQTMELMVAEIRAHPAGYLFIARERYGGVPAVRDAIREQLRRSADELAEDLLSSTAPETGYLRAWPAEDLRMATTLIVDHVVQTAAHLLDVIDPATVQEMRANAVRQLRVIVLGCRAWPGP